MNSYLEKAKSIFRSPAYKSIYRWTKPFHRAIWAISLLGVTGTAFSLWLTLITKNLIDGATSHNSSLLWKYGALLVIIIAIERGLSILSAFLTTKTNARM